MQIVGHHTHLSAGDIRRLIGSVPALSDATSAGEPLIRLLPGGYTGSLVALIWTAHLDPVVLKAGPGEQITAEHDHRAVFTGGDPWLTEYGVDGIYGPVEVEIDGRPDLWSALVYRYIGGKTFEEIDNYGDFEALIRSYLWNTNRDESPSEATLRECFRTIALNLADNKSVRESNVAQPLLKYIPPLRWDAGIMAAINTARSFCPDLPELVGFREWWEEGIASIRVAPVHDDRLLHGDVRFANILVDSVHSEVHLIDFGNGRRGHIFEDFARFETDLLFRTTPRIEGSEGLDQSKLFEAVQYLLRDEVSLGEGNRNDSSRQVKCISQWRQVMYQALPKMTLPGALMMYRWFLLRECLKRTRWTAGISLGHDEPDSASLIYTICALRRRLSGAGEVGTRISTAPQVLAASLRCRAAFVPTRGSERVVNQQRNAAKKAALEEAATRISTVRLLAETGQSYLSARGQFIGEIRDVLSAGGGVQVAICSPYVPEYFGLSKSYEEHDERSYTLNADLLRKTDESIGGFEILHREFGPLIEVRLCRFGVGATVLITDETSFYEPYFRTQRAKRQRLLFDSFELQFDSSGLHSRSLMEETFAFHWRNSDPVLEAKNRLSGYEALREAFLDLWP
ncbi:phosphotransferase [Streptomyces sp. NBC_00370]|uniref:phosphotransferase n=1 Tax=Streptomyces sp. NBC_00370 TaxID=2975728 RepID=UPI002E2588BF